ALADLQEYAVSLAHLSPATQVQRLAAVKSLLSFALETGYLPYNVGRGLRLPRAPSRLAERILPEAQVHRIFALERSVRTRVLLRFLCGTGLRVSEVGALQWKHLSPREKGGQVSVVGKGRKQRVVLVPPAVWEELLELPGGVVRKPEAPVFVSRQGGGTPLSKEQVFRIVQRAASRAGVR